MTPSPLRSAFRTLQLGALAFAGCAAALAITSRLFQPRLPDHDQPIDMAAARSATAARNAKITPDNPPVIWQDVDYREGSSASWWPKGEAPALARQVERGELPPVAERVGPEPVVMNGVEGIGRYGGDFQRWELANSDSDLVQINNRYSACSLVRWSPHGYPLVPHLARAWEEHDGFRRWIFHLRRGVRWSDGHPLTTADILYYWHHEVNDPSLLDRPSAILFNEGEPPEFIAHDDYTLEIRYASPYPFFLERLATKDGQEMLRAPAHYRSRFHPTLGDPELRAELSRRHGIGNPALLYQFLCRWNNPEHPRLWPWVMRTARNNAPYVFERNPYYFAVDTAGNQLPYIDRYIMVERAAGMETVAATNGEFSFHGDMGFGDYSLAMAQRKTGDYRVLHWDPLNRSDFIILPNQNLQPHSTDPVIRQKRTLLQTKEFRHALSLALNRPFINAVEYAGLMEPAQIAPHRASGYHHAELEKAFVDFDPARANRLLDNLGLRERDSEGLRLLPEGQPLHFFLDYVQFRHRGLAQLASEDWRAVGVRVTPRYREQKLWYSELDALRMELGVGMMAGKIDEFTQPKNFVPIQESHWARGYGRWFSQGGMSGDPSANRAGAIEPPEGSPYRTAMELYLKAAHSADKVERARAVRAVFDLAAEQLWTISLGTPPTSPVIVKNGLRNVPEVAVWNWDCQPPASCGLETYFWEDSPAKALSSPPIPPSNAKTATAPPGARQTFGWLIHGLWIAGALGLLLLAFRHAFIARRLLIMIPTLGVISVCVFVIVQLPPGDYLTSYIAQLELNGGEVDKEHVENLRKMFGLDQPVWLQYAEWVGLKWFWTYSPDDRGLLQGFLGLSMESQQPVSTLLGDRLLLTLVISIVSLLLTWVVALPLGIYSAVRQYSVGDYVATLIGFVGMSVPGFLFALIVMFLGNRYLGTPMTGLFSSEFVAQEHWNWPKVVDLLRHLWVPVLVLGVGGTAAMIRIMRGNLLDELRKPYVTTARAKGVRPLRLLLKYPVRLALNPFVSGLGTLFPQLVSGGTIVALILSLPTIGPLLLRSLQVEDMYVAGAMLMLLSIIGVLGTLVSDLLLLLLDPRIRMEEGDQR